MTSKEIRDSLFELEDTEYKEFQLGLMPGYNKDSVVGVRIPLLRKLAKQIIKSGDYEEFLNELPHKYFEEMNLHCFIICEIKDYDKAIYEIDRFIPYVDNWATCDSIIPKKAFSSNLDRLTGDVDRWLSSKDTYTVRFGIKNLMTFYLDEFFDKKHLDKVAAVKSDEYYINMMIAWYFATALAKQYEATIPYIENHVLDEWTHKKSIQKARESFRITPEQKEYLNTLK